jgi:hypothetical protein
MRFYGRAILILLAASMSAEADDRDALTASLRDLSAGQIHTLLETGQLTVRYRDRTSVTLAPAFQEEVRSSLADLRPKIGVEVLFLRPSADASTQGAEIPVNTYNVLRSISTMAGIEYYSASRGRMRTLFFESYAVSSESDPERIPDPLVSSIPPRDSIVIFQRDSSFARNLYRLEYVVSGEAVWVSMINLTPLLYRGLVPAVGAGALEIHMVVKPVGSYLVFYGNSGTSPIGLLGMEERAAESFYNRLVALADWFTHQLLTNQ